MILDLCPFHQNSIRTLGRLFIASLSAVTNFRVFNSVSEVSLMKSLSLLVLNSLDRSRFVLFTLVSLCGLVRSLIFSERKTLRLREGDFKFDCDFPERVAMR